MTSLSRSRFLSAAGAAGLAATLPRVARAADPDRIGVDWAYYNPPSLVLKNKGWLEEALAKRGTAVDWVLSLGSNKANGFLAAGAVQFGSTAGSAALLARANGTPIKTVFLYSRPEWTALVVGKDSPLHAVRDLRGKKIAATRGTPTAASRSSAVRSTRGRGSTRTWRPRSSMPDRGCSTATWRSTRGARSTRARISSPSIPTSHRSYCTSTTARAATPRRTSTRPRHCSPTLRTSSGGSPICSCASARRIRATGRRATTIMRRSPRWCR